MRARAGRNLGPLFQQVVMAGNRSHSVTRDSYQGVADLVQFPRGKNESVFSDAALSYSPVLIVPFSKFCSSVFHLLFLTFFAVRLRQSVRIAFEKQGECHFAYQPCRIPSQDGAIGGTQSDVMLSRDLFHQPAILIVRLLRIESEREHAYASFLLIRSIPQKGRPSDP